MTPNDLLWQGKYRIPSARKVGWDYSEAGAYFVTWCVKGRLCCLGNIRSDECELTEIGNIVNEEWHKTSDIRKDVTLAAWVIMPNHVHGILVFHEPKHAEMSRRDVSDTSDESERAERSETFHRNVSTTSRLRANSLGSIIGQIKSICTKRIWAMGRGDFQWQTRFWDRILRNEREFNAACKYIYDNPINWDKDKDNKEGLYM